LFLNTNKRGVVLDPDSQIRQSIAHLFETRVDGPHTYAYLNNGKAHLQYRGTALCALGWAGFGAVGGGEGLAASGAVSSVAGPSPNNGWSLTAIQLFRSAEISSVPSSLPSESMFTMASLGKGPKTLPVNRLT